jgi:hypothetical protein
MTQCERLSDRMPDVALGRTAWTPEEQAHLEACDDCRAEWALVQGAAHLGDSLRGVRDPAVLTAAVLARVAEERVTVRTRRRAWLVAGLAAAAAVIILVRIPRTIPTPMGPAVASAPQTVALPELDDLPDAELEAILGSLDEPSGAPPSLDDSGLDDLDEHELERVLGTWEG